MIEEVVYPDSPRIGKFNITNEILQSGREREMLQALFGLCVILGVEDHDSGRGKTYIAASDLFQVLTDGEEIPEYRVDCAQRQPFVNPEHEARKLESSNGYAFVATRQIIVRVPPAQMHAKTNVPRAH
jgi:hypothetical protein